MIEFLRLFRASNLLTAVSNVLAGYLLANGSWGPPLPLAMLILASSCFYCAGMVLNDVFDVERDRQIRPSRPLPSGKIPLRVARTLGFSFLASGLILALGAGISSGSSLPIKPIVVAGFLGAAILIYDGGVKATVLGPVVMGSCRALNVLLGCSTAAAKRGDLAGFDPVCWYVALAIGIYVCGITIFARRESESSPRAGLLLGMGITVAGLALLACLPLVFSRPLPLSRDEMIYTLVIIMILLVIVRRLLFAIRVPSPATVQVAVMVCLISLIMIDAAVCFFAAPDKLFYSVVVACLVIPTIVLAQWINPT